MLEALGTHPLLIARLRIEPENGFTLGELRMLVHGPPEGSPEGEFECDVLLFRLIAASGWMEGGTPRQEISGKATLRKQLDGTFIADGSFVAALEIIQPPMDLAASEVRPGEREAKAVKSASASFQMTIHTQKSLKSWGLGPAVPKRGPFNISITLSLEKEREGGGGAPEFQEIEARGSARLYPTCLPALDASGTKRGEYYLPLIPVVLSGSRQPDRAVENFNNLFRQAHDLWSRECGVLIESERMRTLEVTQGVLDDLREGRQGTLQSTLLRMRGQFSAVPIILIEGYSSGWTMRAMSPLWAYTFIAAEPGPNRFLLAHEVGHILGGLDDGEAVTPGRWRESTNASEPNVMWPTGETLNENPAHIGEQGRMFATRWSLFREQSVGTVERIQRVFRSLFNSG